jgi:hypothetical protein
MLKQVLLASVPSIHLGSVLEIPNLSQLVAFGTSRTGLENVPVGTPVFIYASQPPHELYCGAVASWSGSPGAVVRAVEHGPRSGKHSDPSVRPVTAETTDGPFLFFWEVSGLHQLSRHRPLGDFSKVGGGRPFNGSAPQWPSLVQLDC